MKKEIIDILKNISCEDVGRLSGDENIRQALELDSMDMLELHQELQTRFNVKFDVNEMNRLETIDNIESFISTLTELKAG